MKRTITEGKMKKGGINTNNNFPNKPNLIPPSLPNNFSKVVIREVQPKSIISEFIQEEPMHPNDTTLSKDNVEMIISGGWTSNGFMPYKLIINQYKNIYTKGSLFYNKIIFNTVYVEILNEDFIKLPKDIEKKWNKKIKMFNKYIKNNEIFNRTFK